MVPAPARSAASLAVVLTLALALPACGEDGRAERTPAPPGPAAATDCPALGGGSAAGGSVRAGGPGHRPATGAADDDGEPPIGFNSHASLDGAIPIPVEAALQRRAGATLWRVAVDWRFAEPEPGRFELDTHDAIYCEATNRGIRPILHLTGAPDWAADSSARCPVPSCIDPPLPEALGELRSFAAHVARRYPQAAAIEVWNEPNLPTFWTAPDPRRYVEVLAAIAAGVERADAEMPVLGGALSNTGRDDPETGRYAFERFLSEMYEAGAARHMDGLSFHPYPLRALGSTGERFGQTMWRLRQVIRRAGDRDRPLWITEVGIPVGEPGALTEQAQTMEGIYDRLAQDKAVEAVVFHTLLERPGDIASGTGFGWIEPRDSDLFPRPVYCRFAARFAKPLNCSQPLAD